MTAEPERKRLESWKAIARHLGRSVRTVRRWEKDAALPVRRHMHRAQGRVFAYVDELDDWRDGRSIGPGARADDVAAPPAPSPGERSVAVLPFVYLGADASNAFLADGLTEEIIHALSGVQALRVISRTSVMTLRDTPADARSIARLLGVRYLLEGSVQQGGDDLRVAVRLIDPRREETCWASRFDGGSADILAIQRDIAEATVRALAPDVSAAERRQLARERSGPVTTWANVQRAKQRALGWSRATIDDAVAILEREEAAGRATADVLATLGWAWLQYREAGIDTGDGPLEQAARYAEKLLGTKDGSAAGYLLQGWIHYARSEIGPAVSSLREALSMAPNDAQALGLLANCYLISGRVSIARPLIDRVLSLDPLTPLNRCMPGWADLLEGRLEAAVQPYRDMLEMDPANPMSRLFFTWVLVMNGEHESARDVVAGFPAQVADTVPARIARMLIAEDRADAWPELSPESRTEVTASDVFPRILATACALAGERRRATEWLSLAVDRGFINYPFLAEHDPIVGRLRGYRDFDRLLERVRLAWEAFPGA